METISNQQYQCVIELHIRRQTYYYKQNCLIYKQNELLFLVSWTFCGYISDA